MPDSAAQQVVEVRAALSHALGVAEAAWEAARKEHDAAVTRRARIADAARERRKRLAHERDKRLREIDEQRERELAELAGAAAETARLAAPRAEA
ncbi:cell division protein FtsK, partial [Couchioplanes caeruleus subsp. azureus]